MQKTKPRHQLTCFLFNKPTNLQVRRYNKVTEGKERGAIQNYCATITTQNTPDLVTQTMCGLKMLLLLPSPQTDHHLDQTTSQRFHDKSRKSSERQGCFVHTNLCLKTKSVASGYNSSCPISHTVLLKAWRLYENNNQ